jgi:hypothetical protein
MNRFAFTIAMVAGCAEGYGAPESDGFGPATGSASSACASTGSGGAGDGTGGLGGAAGGGGAPAAHGHASSSSVSASGSSTSSSAEASSSSGAMDPVDCSVVPMSSPCDDGLCAPDMVCRPLARCRAVFLNRERLFSCLDSDVRFFRFNHVSDVFSVSYPGCVDHDGDGVHTDLVSCVPGDKCEVLVLRADANNRIGYGRCE